MSHPALVYWTFCPVVALPTRRFEGTGTQNKFICSQWLQCDGLSVCSDIIDCSLSLVPKLRLSNHTSATVTRRDRSVKLKIFTHMMELEGAALTLTMLQAIPRLSYNPQF